MHEKKMLRRVKRSVFNLIVWTLIQMLKLQTNWWNPFVWVFHLQQKKNFPPFNVDGISLRIEQMCNVMVFFSEWIQVISQAVIWDLMLIIFSNTFLPQKKSVAIIKANRIQNWILMLIFAVDYMEKKAIYNSWHFWCDEFYGVTKYSINIINKSQFVTIDRFATTFKNTIELIEKIAMLQ